MVIPSISSITPDYILMNHYSFITSMTMFAMGIFFLINSYSLDTLLNESVCNNSTIKTCILVIQTAGYISVTLGALLFEATLFKDIDSLRYFYVAILLGLFITILVCSIMIKNQLSIDSKCFGVNTSSATDTINTIFGFNFMILGVVILLIILIIFKTYYPAGELVATRGEKGEIQYYQLKTKAGEPEEYYVGGYRGLPPLDKSGYDTSLAQNTKTHTVIAPSPPAKKKSFTITLGDD